jgi:hypothetical protein
MVKQNKKNTNNNNNIHFAVIIIMLVLLKRLFCVEDLLHHLSRYAFNRPGRNLLAYWFPQWGHIIRRSFLTNKVIVQSAQRPFRHSLQVRTVPPWLFVSRQTGQLNSITPSLSLLSRIKF